MKILYYAPNPHLSLNAQTGYGTHMREMIDCWKSMGHEVETLIAGDLGTSGADHNATNSSSVKKLLKKWVPGYIWESIKDRKLIHFDAEMSRILKQRVELFNPDIIYERVSYLQESGVDVAKQYNIRHISEVNAPFPEERVYFSGRSAYLKRARAIEKKILEQSFCLTVVSSALKSYLTEKHPSSESKIHVIPNAVNEQQTNLDMDKLESLRSQYNPENALVFGFVGSIFPYHGVDLLLKAFNKTPGNSILLIVGDGASIPDLKKYVLENDLNRRVFFTGSVPHSDVFHYIQIMDICCMMNSNWYGSPVKIFEYGLMNKAVIAPDVAPVRDVIVHEKDGLLVSNSLDEIQNSLKRLMSDSDLRERLAKSWNKKVLENYTWKAAAEKTLNVCT
jgi:glycosyltransferase involved in cell wall biosynthesis